MALSTRRHAHMTGHLSVSIIDLGSLCALWLLISFLFYYYSYGLVFLLMYDILYITSHVLLLILCMARLSGVIVIVVSYFFISPFSMMPIVLCHSPS